MDRPKLMLFIFILGFICYQVFLVAHEFSTTRIIEVRKEIYYNNEKNYLKGYNIVNYPYEQFDIQVNPKSFLDYLLITNAKGNLLSLILKIAGCVCLALYVFKLDPGDVFSDKSSKWILAVALFIMASFLARSFGLDHTNNFWKSIYSHQGKTDFENYDFYINTKNYYLVYVFFISSVVVFLRYIIDYNKKATITL